MARTVTRRHIDAVLKEIDRRWGAWYADEPANSPIRPQIIRDWDAYWNDKGAPPVPVAIMWETGPHGWAYRLTAGGLNEEMALAAQEFLGAQEAREMARAGKFNEDPAALPMGIHVECGNSYTICLYPKN